ncbi:Pax3- And Pax7-Binding Protein 1 [Manis pentadactyla]|nr:Pax3- And Pax7-Binding Protein 1 [Manis pentadactyla]
MDTLRLFSPPHHRPANSDPKELRDEAAADMVCSPSSVRSGTRVVPYVPQSVYLNNDAESALNDVMYKVPSTRLAHTRCSVGTEKDSNVAEEEEGPNGLNRGGGCQSRAAPQFSPPTRFAFVAVGAPAGSPWGPSEAASPGPGLRPLPRTMRQLH